MLTPIQRFFIAVLCGYLALGATLQVLPIYMTSTFHASTVLIATIIAAASIAAALARPFAGYIADNGFAKKALLVGSVLGFLGGLGHWLACNIALLLGARLLLGAGEGVLFTAAVTWAIAQYAPEKRGVIAGWFGLSMWGGLCLGPVIASLIMNITGNIKDVWIVVSILPLIGFILIYGVTLPNQYCLGNLHGNRHGNRHNQAWPTLHYLLPAAAVLPGVAFLCTSYGYGTINVLLIIALLHQHLGGVDIVLPLFALAFLITRIFCSPIVSKFDAKPVLLSIITIEICGLLLLASGFLSLILVGTVATGLGVALLYPAFVALLVKSVAMEQHGKAIGFMTSFWDLGLVCAGPIGGIVAKFFGFKAVFFVAAGLSFAAFLIILILPKERMLHGNS